MKPTKCKVFCLDSKRTKMLFETEKKAQTFMKFNNNTIKTENGINPIRSYFCISCCGYHLTSKEDRDIKSKTEVILEKYYEVKKDKEEKLRLNNEKIEQRKIESKRKKREKNEKIIQDYLNKFKSV